MRTKRAIAGQGTVYEKNGKYIAQIYMTLASGEKKRISASSSKSEADALKKVHAKKLELEEKEREFIKNQPADGADITVSQAVKNFIDNKRLHVVESTIANYMTYYTGYIEGSSFGNRKVCEVTEQDINAYYLYLLTNGRKRADDKKGKLTVNTVNHVLYLVSATFKGLYESDILSKNPHKRIKKIRKGSALDIAPKYEDINEKILSREEIKILFTEGDDNRFKPAFCLMAILGLRRSELMCLTWDDVSYEKRTLIINKSFMWEKEVSKVKETKSKSSNRILHLNDMALDALKRQKEIQEKEKKIIGETYNTNNYIFCDESGECLRKGRLLDEFHKFTDAHGIKRHTLHELRHTACSIMADAGVNIKVIQSVLGHSNISTTLDIYAQIFKEANVEGMEQSMAKLQQIIQ